MFTTQALILAGATVRGGSKNRWMKLRSSTEWQIHPFPSVVRFRPPLPVSLHVNVWSHLPDMSVSGVLHPSIEALRANASKSTCTPSVHRHLHPPSLRACTFPMFSRPPAELMGLLFLLNSFCPEQRAVNGDR